MNKLLKLLILLILVIIIGMVATKDERQPPNSIGGLEVSEYYIKAVSPPTFQSQEVLASSTIPDCPYYHLISQYEWHHGVACAVIRHESNNDPNAHFFSHYYGDDSWGLFQINLYGNLRHQRPSADWLVVPENNVAYAYEMWQIHGWRPWAVCHNGKVRCWL